MSRKSRFRKKINIIGLLLLAVLCIGGVELLVCRFASPQLFDRITQPVLSFGRQVLDSGKELIEKIPPIHLPSLKKEEAPEKTTQEEAPASQLATDPTLQTAQQEEAPAVTHFAQRKGREVLTGGNVDMVYFNQAEEPWASQPYGSDDIGGYGCGPTSMAMIIATLTDETMTPTTMAQWAVEHGHWAKGSGSYHSLIQNTGAAFGLTVSPLKNLTADSLTQALASGQVCVALMREGHFTSGGHFIVLRGVTLEGKILVADPNSRQRSLTAWDPQLIIDELSHSRSSGAPLWCISTLPQQN